MQLSDVFTHYAGDLRIVEEHLEKKYRSYIDLIPGIAAHIIASGGKRLRPLLLIISADLCGYRGERRHVLAGVIEFIHTASLLHDDVIDHATMRRGKESANRVWGNTASVLVGDYLYSMAFAALAEDEDPVVQKLLSYTTTVMVEGEIVQLVNVGNAAIREQDYLTVIERKTAILISACCAVGAVIAGASQVRVEALSRFGMKLGMAFQITDDTLDYVASEKEFGKAVGTDIREGKITLPLIRTLTKCSAEEKGMIRGILDRRTASAGEIKGLLDVINRYDGIRYALDMAGRFISEGKKNLDSFEDSIPRQSLEALSDYVLERRL